MRGFAMNNDILIWLEDWYNSNCNGDWEHDYGITIETIDNPGWYIKIDLKNTIFENEKIPYELNENNESDWYGYKVENAEFVATGDVYKLSFLLELFRKFVERANKIKY